VTIEIISFSSLPASLFLKVRYESEDQRKYDDVKITLLLSCKDESKFEDERLLIEHVTQEQSH